MAMASDPSYASAIASIESGGKYDVLGPRTKSGDRAYGKYQILGTNIGPWSREILGQELTPEQFIANPQAQDAVFQGKFGQYVAKYGPEGAAQAWIGGPGGVGKLDRKDSLGTSIGDYSKKFMLALGQPPMPAPLSQKQISPVSIPSSGPMNAPAVPAGPQGAQQDSPIYVPPPESSPLAIPPMIGLPQRPKADFSHLVAMLQKARPARA